MQNVERLGITLPAEMRRMIRAKVEEGRYASNSEVTREAMRALREQEQLRAQRLTKVRAKISEADAEAAGRRPEVEGKSQVLAVEKNQTPVPPSA
jgi:antitoxin ParD1/3/4